MSDLTREQAYRRWKKGEDQHALAKEMGVTRERMRYTLKKMDENVPLVDRIEELEAKLAKAVGALKKLDRLTARDAALVQAILAELKGQE